LDTHYLQVINPTLPNHRSCLKFTEVKKIEKEDN